MIYTKDFYQIFLDAIRADSRGHTVDIDEFNRNLRVCNQELYDDYIDAFETNTQSTDDLAYFKTLNYAISLSLSGDARVGNLPANYYYLIGKPRVVNTAGLTRRVDLVTTYEDAVREEDFLTMASETYPTATIGGISATYDIQMRVKPTTLTTVYIDYFRTISTPYLDYYQNNITTIETFLPESTTPQSIGTGYTYRDGTAGGTGVTVTSLTVDMLWDNSDIPLLLAKMLKKAGVQLPDELLIQSGVAEETKNE
jgi:hypothetical protein